MANVVVVGSQWGDEGKGKIVDWLSERADVVVRFQGGHNAGHTLVIDGKTYKLSLLPSGVVRPGKLAIIGNGVVVDPWALCDEIDQLERAGRFGHAAKTSASPKTRFSSCRCTANSMKSARPRIPARASARPKRGIGPAYEDKVGRRALRVMDLVDLDALEDKVGKLLAHHNALRKGLGKELVDGKALTALLKEVAPKVLPFMDTVWRLLDEMRRKGKRILFEGAQGTLLDIDHGTYPYVTSSNTVSAQAAIGSGMGPSRDRHRSRHHQGLYDARRRRPVPERASRRDRAEARRARARVRHGDGAQAPLRLVRRGAGAPGDQDRRHHRHRADQARHARRLRRGQGLRRLRSRRQAHRLSAGLRRAQARVDADLRDARRLAGNDLRRALLGASFRRRRSNMSATSRS